MVEIRTGSEVAPSTSIGQAANTQISKGTSRQTFADTIASKATQAIGAIGSGVATVGGAIAGFVNNQAGMALAGKMGSTMANLQASGGTQVGAFQGPTAMNTAASAQATGPSPMMGGSGSAMTAAGAALPNSMGQSASAQGTAFGAGAGVLPGGDVTGSVGGGSVGGSASMGSNSAIGAAAGGGGGQDQLLNATKQMQETQMSFNLQYLQLQSQMQSENRSYTAVSNIMKTKHDTVKNSISNIR